MNTNKNELTMSFQSINMKSLEVLNSQMPDEEVPYDVNGFYSLEGVLESFLNDGNYKILELCVKFMSNVLPQDLLMFFDEYSSIEASIFHSKGINYGPVKDAYLNSRSLLSDSYVDFILKFYPDSVHGLVRDTSRYTKSQKDFIVLRNVSMMELLPNIGTKISRSAYDVVVVDDDIPTSDIKWDAD